MQNDTKQQLIDSLPDTVYNKDNFIKSLPANFDGIFDWTWMEDSFPRGIMPADIDGLVEFNSHFFAFETKGVGAMVPTGQKYTMEALIRTGYFTIMVIWGDEVEDWTIYASNGGSISGNGKDDALSYIKRWRAHIEDTYDRYGKTKQ